MIRFNKACNQTDLPEIQEEKKVKSKSMRKRHALSSIKENKVISISDCQEDDLASSFELIHSSGQLKLPAIDNISLNSISNEIIKRNMRTPNLKQRTENKAFLAVQEANQAQTRSHSALHQAEKDQNEDQYNLRNKRSISAQPASQVVNTAESAQSTCPSEQQMKPLQEKVKFNFEEWIKNRKLEIQENHRQWVKKVLVQDEELKTKASSVSARAQQELVNTSSYLEQEKSGNDTVNAIKASFARINKTCDNRMEELKKQEEIEREKDDRVKAIKTKRERHGQERTMTFGKVNDMSRIKDAWKNPKPKPVNLNWNPYVKKAVRGGSVEVNHSPNRSAPFKPLMAKAVSIIKSKPIQVAPPNVVQAKQQARTKQIKDAIAARKAIYAAMFSKKDGEYGSESEYDSEY